VVPWEIAFLPDGRALITERPGRVRLLTRNHRLLLAATVAVSAVNGGGALGLALDPAFIRNRFVYLYRTTTAGNEILRYRLVGSRLVGQRVIAHGMPPGSDHHGGRIHFGPDRWLYITTGDTRNPPLSQDRGSLAGKLLRLSPVAYHAARPVRPSIFALGLRNPQGFDWQPHTRLLVATDHGPSGFDGPHGDDEINIVRRGANYGWPIAEGVQTQGAHLSPTAAFWVLAAVPLGLMVYRRSLGEAVGTGGRGGDERWVIEAIARQQRSCLAAMPESPGYKPPGRAIVGTRSGDPGCAHPRRMSRSAPSLSSPPDVGRHIVDSVKTSTRVRPRSPTEDWRQTTCS
jgi:hypothetical protein